MRTLIKREFIVSAPVEAAFDHLAQVERWPSWAKHIRRVELNPPGRVTAVTQGTLHLTNGIKTQFQMTHFDPPRSWEWEGKFLWLTVGYDHRFTAVADSQTRISFIVKGEGLGLSSIGRLFAAAYNANLNRAIPNLIAEYGVLASTRSNP
ncbi:MAG: SRPBCC family protein [Anaerolineales bacterium]|nr:SRPBCC family protein [Anaerolineales bacterium]